MRDPAVEAAKRADEENGDWPWNTTRDAMVEAAREALKPIRELHQRHSSLMAIGLCRGCLGEWPCDTAKLVYPESEL